MKLALVVDRLEHGGLEKVVAHLASTLPAHQVETSVICWSSGGKIADDLRNHEVTVYVVDRDIRALKVAIEREAPHYVNSHSADLQVLRLCHEMGLAVVEHVHNMYAWLDRRGWDQERKRSQYFARVVAVSDLVRRYYVRRIGSIEPERFVVLPNGIDVAQFGSTGFSEARVRLGVAEDAYLIVNLALYDGVKNQLGLLTAFDQFARGHPAARLLCAGQPVNAPYLEEVRSHRERLSSADHIQLDPYRSDVEVILSAADLFVIDSFAEGWSLAATEALAAGVPIIHSDCGSAVELHEEMGNAVQIVSNPGEDPLDLDSRTLYREMHRPVQRNTSELVTAMSTVYERRSETRARRATVGLRAREAFSVDRQAERFAQVLRAWAA